MLFLFNSSFPRDHPEAFCLCPSSALLCPAKPSPDGHGSASAFHCSHRTCSSRLEALEGEKDEVGHKQYVFNHPGKPSPMLFFYWSKLMLSPLRWETLGPEPVTSHLTLTSSSQRHAVQSLAPSSWILEGGGDGSPSQRGTEEVLGGPWPYLMPFRAFL